MNTQNFKTWKAESLENAVIYNKNSININIHAIGYYDKVDKLYNVHALEFDIVGEGKTEKKALVETLELISNHVSFCIAYENKDKIIFPAPDEFWKKFYREKENGYKLRKPQIPKLNISESQMPYRPSVFNQVSLING